MKALQRGLTQTPGEEVLQYGTVYRMRRSQEVLCVRRGQRKGASRRGAPICCSSCSRVSSCVSDVLSIFTIRGMPVQIDLVRRGSAFTRPDGVQPTLSRRKKPSRERQPTALSRIEQQITPT